MNSDQLVRLRYQQLCQELGHLQSNKRKVDKRIAEVESEIDALDRLSSIQTKPTIAGPPK